MNIYCQVIPSVMCNTNVCIVNLGLYPCRFCCPVGKAESANKKRFDSCSAFPHWLWPTSRELRRQLEHVPLGLPHTFAYGCSERAYMFDIRPLMCNWSSSINTNLSIWSHGVNIPVAATWAPFHVSLVRLAWAHSVNPLIHRREQAILNLVKSMYEKFWFYMS